MLFVSECVQLGGKGLVDRFAKEHALAPGLD
jgi:hypothetical protein